MELPHDEIIRASTDINLYEKYVKLVSEGEIKITVADILYRTCRTLEYFNVFYKYFGKEINIHKWIEYARLLPTIEERTSEYTDVFNHCRKAKNIDYMIESLELMAQDNHKNGFKDISRGYFEKILVLVKKYKRDSFEDYSYIEKIIDPIFDDEIIYF